MNRRHFLAGSVVGTAGVTLGSVSAAAVVDDAKAWTIGPKGDFDTMVLRSGSVAAPGPGQVVIKVDASGLAARDLAIARGWFLEDKPADLVPLSEGVGKIVAVGAGVSRLRVGQRVISTHFASWEDGPWTPANYVHDVGNTINGWLTQYATLPASGCVVLPDEISDATAATMSGSGVTAWNALHEVAHVRSGDTVLSLGTGGVSSWGLLLAKAAGAKVVVTSSSDKKLARMRKLGADLTVNYKTTPNWGAAVMDLTNGEGAKVVLENVGRLTLDQSMLAAANNAMIVMIGTGPLPKQLPKMPGFYIRNLALKAISNGSRQMLGDMARAVAANNIEAVVDKEFAFTDAQKAFSYMAQSSHIGKVIIRH